METNYLRTFVWVVEAGSMSEAARRLEITPAAVAQQLRVLEGELGAPLLRRAGRTVSPTEAGHRLLERARALLRDLGHLRAVVADQDQRVELEVGAINTMLHGLMPAVLASLVQARPQAGLVIRSGLTSELYAGVLREELDAAICLHPPFTLPKTVHWAPLREERLVLLAPTAWAKRKPHELLREEHLIRYDRRLGGGQAAERYLQRHGITPRERFEVSSLAAIAMLVARELGVSIAPDATTDWWPHWPVVRLALPQAPQARHFGMVWLRASPRARAIELLAEHAGRAVAALGSQADPQPTGAERPVPARYRPANRPTRARRTAP